MGIRVCRYAYALLKGIDLSTLSRYTTRISDLPAHAVSVPSMEKYDPHFPGFKEDIMNAHIQLTVDSRADYAPNVSTYLKDESAAEGEEAENYVYRLERWSKPTYLNTQ